MNGSQYHYQQALTALRPSTEDLSNKAKFSSHKETKGKKIFILLSLFFLIFAVANIAFAGSSQPKLRGGNGNANGR